MCSYALTKVAKKFEKGPCLNHSKIRLKSCEKQITGSKQYSDCNAKKQDVFARYRSKVASKHEVTFLFKRF